MLCSVAYGGGVERTQRQRTIVVPMSRPGERISIIEARGVRRGVRADSAIMPGPASDMKHAGKRKAAAPAGKPVAAPKPASSHIKFGGGGKGKASSAAGSDVIVTANPDCAWFEALAALQQSAASKTGEFAIADDGHDFAKGRAEHLLQSACAAYEKLQTNHRKGDSSLLHGLLQKGTLQDQVSALAVCAPESPVHLAEFSINRLLAIARKKSREHSLLALEALRDVFGACLLPDHRKLRAWDTKAWNEVKNRLSPAERDQWMVYRMFESRIKDLYSELVTLLEVSCSDPVEWYRIKCLGIIQELLSLKPECEVRFLAVLVNKLGDPNRKVSTRAHRLLTAVFDHHPRMKPVIVDEIERLLLRANVNPRSQHQAIIVLTQIQLSNAECELARKLVDLYMGFFSHRDLSADSRLLSALLTGLNRAFPFASTIMSEETYDKQTDRLFKLAHSTNFNTAIQALMLLFQVMNARQSLSTRFYTAVYESLLSPCLATSSKHSLYLNLIYRTMKNDVSLPRVAAFSKRLLQVCLHSRPGFICGSLLLLSEVAKIHAGLWALVVQSPDCEDDLERFHDDEEDIGSSNPSGPKKSQYDMQKRDPQFAQAQSTCLWELALLAQHYHPSVTKFVNDILSCDPVVYKGNPIQDFTTAHFLDRFVYRNPKKNLRQTSRMAPRNVSAGKLEPPANTEAFWGKDESLVREDEKFMHRYFRMRVERGDLVPDDGKDEEQFAEELFERELAKTDGPVDIDDDVDSGDDESDDVADGEDVVSDEELDEMFNDDENGDAADLGGIDSDDESEVEFGGDDGSDGDVEDEAGSSKKKSRFVDAADFAQLLELSQDAARANAMTEKWQSGKHQGKERNKSKAPIKKGKPAPGRAGPKRSGRPAKPARAAKRRKQ